MSFFSRFRGNLIAFPLAALATLAVLAISETSYREATSSLDSLGDRGTARTRLNDLVKGLLEAESSQRGYLLTGRKDFFEAYRQALDSAHQATGWLQPYYARDPQTAALMQQIVAGSEAKLAELARTIELRDQGGKVNWREIVVSESGVDRMDRVRVLGEQLLTTESEQVLTGRQSVYQILMLNRIGVSAMAAISLLALFMYLRQAATLDRALKNEGDRVAGERDRLEREVAARTAQLKELAHHLQTVREDERSHLARELHDELGALLTAAKLDVARLKSRLLQTTAPENLERLAHLNDTLNGGIALKRRIIEDLRPSSLSNLGLIAALEILVREFADRSDLLIANHFEPVQLNPSSQLTVYRLVQEALTNIAKYARASEVTVTLAPDAATGAAHVSIRDDGIGFDMLLPRLATHGLIGMRYRVEAEGGVMNLESADGAGTLIEATLPRSGELDIADSPLRAESLDAAPS